ncbi:MAG: carbamoyl phosphate synthase large subunit, partial [Candidatus Omnitrophica bacterium]|nr:carbamoyl phosphate synthase large subunit [Candidatus Omnitrophota bacterium]
IDIAKRLKKLGFSLFSTKGTSILLKSRGIENTFLKKLHEGRPNISDAIKNKEINLIVNTPVGRTSKHDDSYIRIMAIQHKLPYITTMAAARASVEAIESMQEKNIVPKSLQEYHNKAIDIKNSISTVKVL